MEGVEGQCAFTKMGEALGERGRGGEGRGGGEATVHVVMLHIPT